MSALLVPTPAIALSYFILEQLTFSLKYDPELNKNFRVLGPQGTSKSVILNTFIERSKEQFDSVIIPMSSHLSIDKLEALSAGPIQRSQNGESVAHIIPDLCFQRYASNCFSVIIGITNERQTWAISDQHLS